MKEIITIAVEADVVDLTERFLRNRLAQTQEWGNAPAAQNTQVPGRLGHDLKGSAGAFGIRHLSDLADKLEEAVISGDLVATEARFERLIDSLNRTVVVSGKAPIQSIPSRVQLRG